MKVHHAARLFRGCSCGVVIIERIVIITIHAVIIPAFSYTSMGLLLRLCSVSLLCASVLAGCTTDPGPLPREANVVVHGMPPSPAGTHYTLRVSTPVSGKLASSSGAQHSEAAYVAIGTFTVPSATDTIPLNIEGNGPVHFVIPDSVETNILQDAIITIDVNTAPPSDPGIRFLAGDFTGDNITARATLALDGRDAFGSAFSTISGEAALDAPTGTFPADSARGIWFVAYNVDGSGTITGVGPGLTLPILPVNDETEGWSYQGWIARQANSVTTIYTPLGRFFGQGGSDNTGAGPGAGAGTPYPYPGEDFVTGAGARSLNDGRTLVIVSLDPVGIALDKPFLPLMISSTISEAIPSRTPFLLQNSTREPSVQVSIRR